MRARQPLRVGLLLDGLEQPQWVHDAVARMLQEGHAQVSLVVRNATPHGHAARRGRVASWIANRRVLAHALYHRIDTWKFSVERDPFVMTSLAPLVAGAPVIDVTPRQTKHSDYIEDADIERILAHDLDVVVRFGFRILRGRALTIARHGVWSYHHGDSRVNRGGPPGFWEVMERQHVTGAVLQVLGESLDDGRVLCRGWSRTDRYSVRRNRAVYYWQAVPFLARAIRDLALDGDPGRAGAPPEPEAPVAYSERLYTAPGNVELVKRIGSLAASWTVSHLRTALSEEQWIIGYRLGAPGQDGPDLAPHRFRMMIPPDDRFWADPFPVVVDGRHYVFFEDFVTARGRAHIAVFEVDARGNAGPMREALATDYHLSYPYVFEWQGQHYMVPETAAMGRVELWRATRFPDQWSRVSVLLDDRPLVDATITQVDGRWWMFAAGTESGGDAWDELYLYHADSPLGPWRPHARNPVISDVRSARPAGRLFCHGGAWYRPAQDGSRRYGGAMTIQRIDQLDDEGYRETAVSRLEPHWRRDLVATHTINAAGSLTALDARRTRWFWQR
ncbi:MAG: hypothetical protein IT361_01350 [Gemmatimonadaceae bacterium]|nr:hypothetical protein [Gemmatimonadaceae bacterium]